MNKEQQDVLDEAYENYEKHTPEQYVVGSDSDPMRQCMVWKRKTDSSSGYPILERLSKEEFINRCKTDTEFSERWGLKIEERELSNDERFRIAYKDLELRKKLEAQSKMIRYPDGHNEVMDDANIPTKLITVTYNNKTIESYE
jgi:hypothetical protein